MLPQATLRDQGYKGTIYQTHAVATDDFIRLGKDKVEGTILAAGPMLVIDEIPDGNPTKKVAQAYIAAYEKQFGVKPATFGANTWDGGLLLERAIPIAAKAGKPGTEAFRVALRDALEQLKEVVGCQGVFNMSRDQPQRHGRARARAGDDPRRQVPAAAGVTAPRPAAPGAPAHRPPRDDRAVGVLLAAGRGERFGGDKLRAPLPVGAARAARATRARDDGQAAARRQPPRRRANASASPPRGRCSRRCRRSSPWCAPDDDALAHALGAAGATIVRCADAGRGMGASLACGVRAVRARHPDAAGVVVALADMPWVRPATIARVAAAVAGGAAVAAPFHDGRRGHPVGFGAACFDALAALDGDDGARAVVAAHGDGLRAARRRRSRRAARRRYRGGPGAPLGAAAAGGPHVGLAPGAAVLVLLGAPPRAQLRLVERLRDQEALRFLAAVALQEFELRRGLDALGDHAQARANATAR